MTNFGWWAELAAKSGLFMCQICYEGKPPEQAWEDTDGQKWDVCLDCAAIPGNVEE